MTILIFFFALVTIVTITGNAFSFFTLLLARIYTYIFTWMPKSFTRATFDDTIKRERDSERRAHYQPRVHAWILYQSFALGEREGTLVPFGKWTFVICRGIEYKRVDSCRDELWSLAEYEIRELYVASTDKFDISEFRWLTRRRYLIAPVTGLEWELQAVTAEPVTSYEWVRINVTKYSLCNTRTNERDEFNLDKQAPI